MSGGNKQVGWAKPVIRTLSDQVAEEILRRIASGELRPGNALPPQRELARELDVGLSVIREAIQRLQVLKVVRTRHGSGTVIEELRWNHIASEPALQVLALEPALQVQISEARYAVEQETTRLAALRATDEDIAALEAVLDSATPAPTSFDASHSLNTKFHMTVARATRNQVLADLLEPLLQIGFTTIPEVFDEAAVALAWKAHRLIVEAIRSHDVEATREALRFHAGTAVIEIEKIKASWGPRMDQVDPTVGSMPRRSGRRLSRAKP